VKTNVAAPFAPRSARHAATAIIFVMVVISCFLAFESYYAEKIEIARLLTSSVAALDYQTDRSFRAIDDLLSDASGRIDPGHEPDNSLISWFQGRLSAFPEIRNVLVVKANGQSVSSGLTVDGTTGQIIDVSDREYFRYHLAHPEDHGIHIGEGIVSRLDGQFGFPVSRAIYDGEGKFAGVVRALVSPQFLIKGLAVLRAREDGFSVLLRSDGVTIAQAPVPEASPKKPLFPSNLFRNQKINSSRETVSPQTGETLILASATLGHYPLIVVSGVPKWAALSEWKTRSYWVLGLLTGLSLALYSGAVWSDRRERLRASLMLATQQAEINVLRAQQQFLDAIETVSDGFAFYDNEDRLVVSNAQYRAMFAGAEDVIQPGNHFADIVRVVGERGIYGFEGRALESFLSARIAEHSAPTGRALLHPIKGGRWIVSKEFRTHDGGVVATRTDVTELRRREEEVEALKKRYELILDSAGDGIIGISADETISFANHTACRMLETSVNALNGLNYRKVLYGSTAFAELPSFPIPNDLAGSRETSFLHSDGSNFIAEYVLAPIHQDDVFQGAVLVFRDISLRKRYEAGLADHQKELENQVTERTRKLSSEIEQRSRTEEALRKSQGRLLGITSTRTGRSGNTKPDLGQMVWSGLLRFESWAACRSSWRWESPKMTIWRTGARKPVRWADFPCCSSWRQPFRHGYSIAVGTIARPTPNPWKEPRKRLRLSGSSMPHC
jgi:PAS domain S-box-containing protein